MPEESGRLKAVLSPEARRDIREALRWSETKFGPDARLRYESLIVQALRDIESDPLRPGSSARRDLTIEGVRTYHIGLSRDRARTPTGVVHKPRHFILYRRREEDGKVIDIGRVLRDDRDLVRHLPVGFRLAE